MAAQIHKWASLMDVFAGLECRIDAKLNINKNIYLSQLQSVNVYIPVRLLYYTIFQRVRLTSVISKIIQF